MDWTCIVKTAPREPPTLGITTQSIRKAGWDNPIVMEDTTKNLVSAWIKAVELALQRNAEYYLITEDDVIFCKNTRQYIEKTVPYFDVCSLFSLIPSIQYAKFPGWMRQTLGMGSQAYILTNSTCREIIRDFKEIKLDELNSENDFLFYGSKSEINPNHNVPYTLNQIIKMHYNGLTGRTWKLVRKKRHVDFHVNAWVCRNNKVGLLHSPILCGHIGVNSSINNEYMENTFCGEDFDALFLIKKFPYLEDRKIIKFQKTFKLL